MSALRNVLMLGIVLLAAASHGSEPASAKIGQAKPSWQNLPGTDGKKYSLADFAAKKVIVVAITCNHCPIAMEYFERLREFCSTHCGPQSEIALVAISVSNMESDKLDRMKQLAERESFNFPYLYDASQAIAKQLGAVATPQFFVLNEERTLVYRGPWDDQVNRAKVKVRYVEDAVNALREGRSPPASEVRTTGCAIRYGK
jgi:peroxiredoxin